MNWFTVFSRRGTIAVATLALAVSVGQADVIVQSDFTSTNDKTNKTLAGTTTDLAVNEPGGNWTWGAGWNWGTPLVMATWNNNTPLDAVNMAEEDTALGVSIASTGGYTKPALINISGSVLMTGGKPNLEGLGFWSTMPDRADNAAASSVDHFTGLILSEGDGATVQGTLRVYAEGSLVGSAVNVGYLTEGTWYDGWSYDIDTSTGALSNVTFNGSSIDVADFNLTTNSYFTDAATANAGFLTGGNSRGYFDNFVVQDAVVPEPASLALLGLSGLLIAHRRRA